MASSYFLVLLPTLAGSALIDQRLKNYPDRDSFCPVGGVSSVTFDRVYCNIPLFCASVYYDLFDFADRFSVYEWHFPVSVNDALTDDKPGEETGLLDRGYRVSRGPEVDRDVDA